jgi:hypothetical protein
MKEHLLHFIWKLKLVSIKTLETSNKEKVEIISVGTENLNTGPDFLNAKIRINNQLWVGNVEIHVKSSDWYLHKHEIDENYDAIILHVVWEHDVEVFRKNNDKIATVELKNNISAKLLDNYNQLFSKKKKWINCENDIQSTTPFILTHWLEQLYFEKLEQKAVQIQQILHKTTNNWEATLFILLAKNFGLKVNADAFISFALSFDFSIVRKVASKNTQLEALFFGQAGLLSINSESVYFNKLKNEYAFLKRKFRIVPISANQVQFFRLRPNNFPTIRLSQLASLYNMYQNLFSKIFEIQTLEGFYDLLNVSSSTFWDTHYTFDKESNKKVKRLTKSFIDLVLINTIIPLKFMYLKSLGKSDFSSVITIMNQIKPEKNTIISKFSDLKIKSVNAFETQALLQLKNEYCNKQRCLQCSIGNEILKS